MRTLLVVSLSLSFVACGGFVDVKRKQTALYTFKTGEAPSVSLIQVSGGQDARGTPESFEELKGLIADAAKKYLSEQTPPATFEDLHGSGYNADFGVDLSKGFVPAAAVKLNGPFPASVKTNLVTIAYIFSIKTSMTNDKEPVNKADVSLLLATYTRSGELVRSEIIYGDLAGKSFGSTHLTTEPASG
ncbi:MAG: hypothetical protein JST92_25685, partial [Deltaproteobacteria bacterium]|nr:hypothetical protein [Deltaproteobacteria bacterium]